MLGDDEPTGVVAARQVDVGCVRLTERHLHDATRRPPDDRVAAATRRHRRGAASRAGGRPAREQAAALVGLAGSVTTVAAMALRLPEYDPVAIHGSRIGAADVRAVSDRLLLADRATSGRRCR